MKVFITDKETGSLIAEYVINLRALNYEVQESEYFDEAWENAVQDKLITKGSRQDYNFNFELGRKNGKH